MNGKPQILIVDDDPQSLFVLERVLSGYKPIKASSGEEALSMAETLSPDLILLDIMMPGLDGFDVCEVLKKNPKLKEIPVIFITASGDPDELVKGFSVGAIDFISKPFHKSELLARVNTHLELKKSKDLISANNMALKDEVERRKQLEEKYRALAEMTHEAVFFVQSDRIVEANNSGLNLLGIADLSKTNVFLHSLVRAEDLNRLRQITDSKEEGPWEMQILNTQGKLFYALLQHGRVRFKKKSTEVITIRDISRQKQIDHEIMQAVLLAEDKERKRFARDLHDGLGALLSTLKIYVGLLQKDNKSPKEKQNLLAEMKDTVIQAVNTTRSIANNLMPGVLMDYGLIKALLSFIESLQSTGIIKIEHQFPPEIRHLDNTEESHVYRIVMELINNTLKHSGASRIFIHISESDKGLCLDYRDNGKGLEEAPKGNSDGNGLSNIVSRTQFLKARAEFSSKEEYPFCFFMHIAF